MKTSTLWLALAALAGAAGGGFWLGARQQAAATAAPTVTSSASAASAAASVAAPARRLLYYRNPMGLPDTSPVPKKDPMGMDYIAVYEGEEPAAEAGAPGTVRLGPEKIQKLGVRTEAVAVRDLARTVRASGRVEPDERRITMISPKFEGYVERLHVNATGQPVARGQPLFEVYSPELVSAQREYLIAMQGVQAMKDSGGDALPGMRQLAESALARLRNWDLAPDDLAQLVRSGEVRRTVTLRSPVGGVVTEKKAFQGMRFMPGEALYQVTDLGAVWVIADVYEQDLGLVRSGAKATLKFNAYPAQTFTGRVTYVYPTLKPETRTVPVRIELGNPSGQLKPAMFAQVELQAGAATRVLAVPDSAVIDTGRRQLVLVQRAEGRFEPRDVRLGARGDNFVEVLGGLAAGEQVVVAANFLIDAESNLKAVIGAMGAPAAPAAASAASAAAPTAPAAPAAPRAAAVGHTGRGSVDGVDPKAGVVSLNHEAIDSLKWPAMTMEFKLANPALGANLKPGQKVEFEFVERAPGEWVVTAIRPAGAGGHRGH